MQILPIAILSMENAEDRRFIEGLIVQYGQLMYWTARRKRIGWQDADDVISEANLVLVRKVSVIRHMECNILRGYVIKVVENTAKAFLRAAGRARANERDADILDLLVDPGPGPEERILRGELMRELAEIIKELSDRDQRLLRLKYMDKMTDMQIAQEMGMDCRAVRTALTRMRGRLQRLMERAEYEFETK